MDLCSCRTCILPTLKTFKGPEEKKHCCIFLLSNHLACCTFFTAFRHVTAWLKLFLFLLLSKALKVATTRIDGKSADVLVLKPVDKAAQCPKLGGSPTDPGYGIYPE